MLYLVPPISDTPSGGDVRKEKTLIEKNDNKVEIESEKAKGQDATRTTQNNIQTSQIFTETQVRGCVISDLNQYGNKRFFITSKMLAMTVAMSSKKV